MRRRIVNTINKTLCLSLFFVGVGCAEPNFTPDNANYSEVPMEVARIKSKNPSTDTSIKASPNYNGTVSVVYLHTKKTRPHPLNTDIYPGSLEGNIDRIAKYFGWPVMVWDVPNDYDWVGQTHIFAPSLPDLLTQILENYPLQAEFYEGNHVLVIVPRTLKP